MAAATTESEPPVILFSTLGLLQIIKGAQAAHGLRHGDYQRYRQYCARKVRRVRKSLKFTHAHKAQARHAAKFVAKKVTPDVCTDANYLIIPLFDAERCWAHGMQLKAEAAENPAYARRRFHMMAKLRKAVRHVDRLEHLCKTLAQVDSATKLESQAYASWMRGVMYFELKQWSQAAEHFNTARTIYKRLADVVADKSSAEAELYTARIEEMQPALRYCAYETGDASAVDDLLEMRRLHVSDGDPMQAELDKLLAATRDTIASKEKMRVSWCGHTISLEEPFKVYQFHDQLTNFDQLLEATRTVDEKLAAYENLLILCRDAVQSVRDWAKGENLKTKRVHNESAMDGEQGASSWSPAQLLYSYLCAVRAEKTYQRYMLQIQQAKCPSDGKKPAKDVDLIRLYDAAIQNLSELSLLPGIEDSTDTLESAGAKQVYLRAARCLHVAHAYASMDKLAHALKLYDRAAGRIAEAAACVQLCHDDRMSAQSLDEMGESATRCKYQVLGRQLVQQHAGDFESGAADKQTDKDKHRAPILSKPDDYPTYLANVSDSSRAGVPPLVACPPPFRPAPAKPLFFDLALNHVRFPDLQAQIAAPPAAAAASAADSAGGRPAKAAAKKRQPADADSANEEQGEQGGISGMVKGWFWGGKK